MPIDPSGATTAMRRLADNGGPTQTHALLPGSIAIGGGNSYIGHVMPPSSAPATDQRRAVRDDTPDIGAFESVPDTWIDDVSIREGSSGVRNAVVTVRLTRPTASPLPVSLDYATEDVTATAGADYLSVAGTLDFGANQSSRFVIVPVLGDTLVEGNETVVIRFGSPTVGMLRRDGALATILDDDKIVGAGNYVLSLDESGQRRLLTRSGVTILDQATGVDGVGGKLEITGAKASADSLTVDATNGYPVPTAGVVFNGLNTGGNDRVILAGLGSDGAELNYSGPRAGAIRQVDQFGEPIGPSIISFAGVEQVTATTALKNVYLRLPASNDTAYLHNTSSGSFSLQGTTLPATTLLNPDYLMIDGRGGADKIIVDGPGFVSAGDLQLMSDIVSIQSTVDVANFASIGGVFKLTAGKVLRANAIYVMHPTINLAGRLYAKNYYFGGNILVTGEVTFSVDAAHPPSAALMYVDGNLNIAAGSTIRIDTGTSSGVAGVGPYPLASVGGVLSLSPKFKLAKAGAMARAVNSVFADLANDPDVLRLSLIA